MCTSAMRLSLFEHVQYCTVTRKTKSVLFPSRCDYFFILCSWTASNTPTGQKDDLCKCLELQREPI